MKMRQLNVLPSVVGMAAIMGLAACGTAQKQETAHSLATATGTRGGGEVITTANGQQQLRDLTEKTNCTWEMGKNVAESLPTFENIADSASKQHWSYGPLLKQGAAQLSVCFTEGNLIRVDTTDLGDSLAWVELLGKQAAIRYNNKLYVDNKIWTQLNQQQKGYLFAHEVLHSFLSMQEKQRNQKLRTAVNMFIKNSQSEIDHETFMFNLTENKINFGTDIQLKFKDRFPKEFQSLYQEKDKYKKIRVADKLIREANLAIYSNTPSDPNFLFSKFDQEMMRDAFSPVIDDVRYYVLLGDSDGLLRLFKDGLPIQIARYVDNEFLFTPSDSNKFSASSAFLKAARAADFSAEEYNTVAGAKFFYRLAERCVGTAESFNDYTNCMTDRYSGNMSQLLVTQIVVDKKYSWNGSEFVVIDDIVNDANSRYRRGEGYSKRSDWILSHALSSYLDFGTKSRSAVIEDFCKKDEMSTIQKKFPLTYQFLNRRR